MIQRSYDKALAKAASLCSKSERAPKEIFDKLMSWGISAKMAEQIVNYLREENFIEESRYARAFVHDKFQYEHWGRLKITFALHNKGISDAIVGNSIEEQITHDEYLSALIELLKGKMRTMDMPLSQKDRSKLYRYATQKGFETSIIAQALRNIGEDIEEW